MGGVSVRQHPQRDGGPPDRRAFDRGAIGPRSHHIASRPGTGGFAGFDPQDVLAPRLVGRDRGYQRRHLVLGSGTSARQTGLPSRRRFCPRIVSGRLAMNFGIDRLIAEPGLRAPLKGTRVALLAPPASVTKDLTHSLDALAACGDIKLNAALGPQHGLRGDKQDNMIESPDFNDPAHGIPVFSLYGEVRKPTDAMMGAFDVLLVDLQDLGCRIYTFITTLRYVLEAAAKHRKSVWVLDRPNPAGRPIEGLTLRAGWGGFVGF